MILYRSYRQSLPVSNEGPVQVNRRTGMRSDEEGDFRDLMECRCWGWSGR